MIKKIKARSKECMIIVRSFFRKCSTSRLGEQVSGWPRERGRYPTGQPLDGTGSEDEFPAGTVVRLQVRPAGSEPIAVSRTPRLGDCCRCGCGS